MDVAEQEKAEEKETLYSQSQILGVGLDVGTCRAPCVTVTWELS